VKDVSSEYLEKLLKSLALLGFFAFGVGLILLTILFLQNNSVAWEIQLMLIGLLLLLMALFGSKIFSK